MRILLVSAYYPDDMSFGAGQRTSLLARALRSHGEVKTLILREGHLPTVRDAPAPGVIAEIGYPEPLFAQKYQRQRSLAPLLKKVVDVDAFDVVAGRYVGPLLALPPFRGFSVVDADDAYYRYPSNPTLVSKIGARARGVARSTLCRSALRRIDHVWFSCERDREHFSALTNASVLPNVVLENKAIDSFEVGVGAPVILMVGALWYRPNRDAVDRFLARCWQAIRREVPDAVFRAVGAAPPDVLARWQQHQGVSCPGFVDDLATEYRRARLTVVPVESGGGTQIKVLESLANGRVPVVSSFVASGFDPHLRHRESLLVAADDEALVANTLSVLRDPHSAGSIARRGRDVVSALFSYARFERVVAATLASISAVP